LYGRAGRRWHRAHRLSSPCRSRASSSARTSAGRPRSWPSTR